MAEMNSTRARIGRPSVDYTGRKIGSRLVLGRDEAKSKHWKPLWKVRCDCGNEFSCLTQALKLKRCMMCAHKGPRPSRRKRPFEASYNIFVGRARYPVSISYEDFVALTVMTECHYCGDEISWQEYRTKQRRGSGSNIDRKDSSKPYDMENVVVCCGRCNYAKNDHFSYEEWKQIGALIRSWRAANVPDR